MTPEPVRPATLIDAAMAVNQAFQPIAPPGTVATIIEDLERQLAHLDSVRPDVASGAGQPLGSIAAAHHDLQELQQRLVEALERLGGLNQRRRDVVRSLEVLRASLEQDAPAT